MFEGVDGVAVSGAHGGEDECLEGQAESVGVEVDVVAADRTGLFQGSQAAVAGRKAEADAPGQLGNGQAPVLLQFTSGGHTGQGTAAHLDRWLRLEHITRCRMLRLVC